MLINAPFVVLLDGIMLSLSQIMVQEQVPRIKKFLLRFYFKGCLCHQKRIPT